MGGGRDRLRSRAMYYDDDADLDLLQGKTVAILGCGSQGHAHARNLKDSGVDVVVGLREESKSVEHAKAAGLEVTDIADAASRGDIVMVLLPDERHHDVYEESIKDGIAPGNLLMFGHGFSIHYNEVEPPPEVDVALVALPRVALTGTVRRTDTLAPIAGATVKVAGTTLAVTTAGDGSYGFPEVAIGQWTVTAEAWGFSGADARTVLAEDGAAVVDLSLAPGRFTDDAETNRGWTLGNVAGDTATSGRWERVDPNPTGGGSVQPADDHTPAPEGPQS